MSASASRSAPASLASELHLHTFSASFEDTTVHLTAVLRDDEPWFQGRDLVAQLGFKQGFKQLDKVIQSRVTGEDVIYIDERPYVSEDGLYTLLWDSKVSYKNLFRSWVVKIVLPKLRQQMFLAEREEATAAAPRASHNDTTTEGESAPESPPTIEPPQVDWERHKARLEALMAARAFALASGVPIGEAHQRVFSEAINEVVLPAGHDQKDMIGAAEFLRRKGHSPEENFKLATEFGKALKHAYIAIYLKEPISNAEEFEAATNDVRRYHALENGLFLEEVYAKFATRSLYITNCAGYEQARTQMKAQVAAVLQNARGFARPAERAGNRR